MRPRKYVQVELSRFDDGSVDVESTLKNCLATVQNFIANRPVKAVGMFEDESIANAVAAVFDSNPCAYHNKRAVVFGALRHMNITDPEEQAAIAGDIERWLDDRTDKNGTDTGLPFVSKNGRSGGLLRRGLAGVTEQVTIGS